LPYNRQDISESEGLRGVCFWIYISLLFKKRKHSRYKKGIFQTQNIKVFDSSMKSPPTTFWLYFSELVTGSQQLAIAYNKDSDFLALNFFSKNMYYEKVAQNGS
jgi:hypothetical protein